MIGIYRETLSQSGNGGGLEMERWVSSGVTAFVSQPESRIFLVRLGWLFQKEIVAVRGPLLRWDL